MTYRKEIDGFRALCVVSVIFFHANIPYFSGGYIGVDVFFVISGYLITSLIIDEIGNQTFSIKDFYIRRIRRLLPALFFVLLCCLPVGILYLSPYFLLDFSKNLLSSLFFLGNLYIHSESGYFETFSNLKPLLHTWSLAIEEQYYLVFPFFMMVFWKINNLRTYGVVLLLVIFVLSFTYAIFISNSIPGSGFYLTLARIWEILIGCFCALYISGKSKFFSSYFLNNIISGLGLFLLLFSLFIFEKNSNHPGLLTLLPVFGAVFIILSGNTNTFVGRLLSQKIFVFTGLISYSAYLWHQPIFAFSKFILKPEQNDLSLIVSFFLILLIFFIAWISWKYIELPFREKTINNNYKINIYFLLFPFIVLLFASLYGITSKGMESRFSDQIINLDKYNEYQWEEYYRQYECFLETENEYEDFDDKCFRNNKNYLVLWGDSLAASMYPGLNNYFNISQLTTSGCAPLLFNENYRIQSHLLNARPNCKNINKEIYKLISNSSVKTIILQAAWDQYNLDDVQIGLKLTLNKILINNPKINVLVLGTPLSWFGHEYSIGTLKQRVGENKKLINIETDLNKLKLYDNHLKKIVNSFDRAHIILIDELMCDKQINVNGKYNCVGGFLINKNIVPYVWDSGHHTVEGSKYIAKKLSNQINKIHQE